MEKLFYRYNPHWENGKNRLKYIERPALLDILTGQLKNRRLIFMSGLRRVGKTTFMRIMIDHLIRNEKVPPPFIFYLSLDNYMFRDKTLAGLIEKYRQVQNLPHDRYVYLFLDEISFLKDYEIQLKNLYDMGYCKIIASASNASLLRSRKPFLTGRSHLIEIPPLNFEEYLLFKGLSLKKSDDHLTENFFTDFLNTGGIPEYVLTGEVAYIQELVDDIIYKDIVAQYQLKNPRILRDFFLLLMERAGKQFSINKIAAILKISTERAKLYLEYFADTYLIHLVERKGKTNTRLLAPRKVYATDLGIRNFFTGYRDTGAVFENYVYLKIKKWKPKYLYEDRTEIDFVINNDFLIEVKFRNAEMNTRQKRLFNQYPAKYKFIINNYRDIENMMEVLKTKTPA